MNVAAKLSAFINQRNCEPFKWGKNDCCLFVADWVLFATGNDVAADFRGNYRTENGAFKQLFKRDGAFEAGTHCGVLALHHE